MRELCLKVPLAIALIGFAAVASCWAQDDPTKGKAVIYVYSYNVSALGTVHKTVYLDDKPLADVTPGRYFVAVVEPGNHTLSWKEKRRGGVAEEFEADTVSYVRAGWNEGGLFIKPAGLTLMPVQNGLFDIKQLRPVENKNIKDRTKAFVNL